GGTLTACGGCGRWSRGFGGVAPTSTTITQRSGSGFPWSPARSTTPVQVIGKSIDRREPSRSSRRGADDSGAHQPLDPGGRLTDLGEHGGPVGTEQRRGTAEDDRRRGEAHDRARDEQRG